MSSTRLTLKLEDFNTPAKAVHVLESAMQVTKPVQLFQDYFSLPLATKSLVNTYFQKYSVYRLFISEILLVIYLNLVTLLDAQPFLSYAAPHILTGP